MSQPRVKVAVARPIFGSELKASRMKYQSLFESSPGNGTRVTVSVPFADDIDEQRAQNARNLLSS